MASAEQTVEAHFDMRRPSEVSFDLPIRVPHTDAATSLLNTLRKVHGIDQVTCLPDSYKLTAIIARSNGVSGLLGEIMLTMMELMGISSVHEFAVRAKRAQTSMLAEEHLDDALRRLAEKEWDHYHSLALETALDSWKEIDQRIQALSATEAEQVADEARTESELNGTKDALDGARQSYSESRHADVNDDGLRALGQVVTNFVKDVKDLEEMLGAASAELNATRQELSVLVGQLEEARLKVEGIKKLTRPVYRVKISKGGKVALFTLKTIPGNGEPPEDGEGMEPDQAVESNERPDDETDKVLGDKS